MAASIARPAIRALISTGRSLGQQRLQPRRAISATPFRNASTSILFALSSLSNSRETQHFNKLTRLSRIEHSPPLKLIKTSEVDPYPLPELPKRGSTTVLPSAWVKRRQRNDRTRRWDEQALKVGRAILAANAHRETRLKLALRRAQRRAEGEQRLSILEREQWRREHRRLKNELRVAGIWIIASIGTATALATWRFWPEGKQGNGELNNAEFAHRMASRARNAIPLPAARSAGQRSRQSQPQESELEQRGLGAAEATAAAQATVNADAGLQGPIVDPVHATSNMTEKADIHPIPLAVSQTETSSWWQGWFWKQE